jgi:hypothetical protein
MLAIPANKMSTFQHPDAYLLNYFTKALQLLQHLNEKETNLHSASHETSRPCSFYMPEALASLASKFKVPGATAGEKVEVIQWRPNVTTYSSEVYGLLPESVEWGVEDVRTLRSAWQGERNEKAAGTKTCVVLMDEIFTAERIERIGECLREVAKEGETWEVLPLGSTDTGPYVYSKLMEADLCILYNLPERPATHWMKLWAVPAGCKVLEFQNELKVTGDFQHFAAACELETYLFPLHKAPIEGVFAQAVEAFQSWLKRT